MFLGVDPHILFLRDACNIRNPRTAVYCTHSLMINISVGFPFLGITYLWTIIKERPKVLIFPALLCYNYTVGYQYHCIAHYLFNFEYPLDAMESLLPRKWTDRNDTSE